MRGLGRVVLVLVLAAACSSSSSSSSSTAPPPCNTNPFQCAAGQTCWSTELMPPKWSCLPSGTGKLGGGCTSFLGTAVCGDGLACIQSAPNMPGTCCAECIPNDSSHGCPSGQHCIGADFGGGTGFFGINLCAPDSVTSLNGGFENH